MEYDICHMNIACSSMLYMYFLLLLLFQQSIIWIFYVCSSFSSSNVTKTAFFCLEYTLTHIKKTNEKNLVIVLILSRFVIEQIMSSDPTPPDYNADNDDSKDDEMFTSAISPSTATVPLDDDDEDDVNDTPAPFGLTSNQSVVSEGPTSSFGSTIYDSHVEKKDNNDSDDEDPFGAKKPSDRSSVPTTPSAPVPSNSPTPSPSTPSQLYPSTFAPSTPSSPQPSGFDTQVSSSSPDYKADYGQTEGESATPRQRINDDDIEITVSDPTKIGDVSFYS